MTLYYFAGPSLGLQHQVPAIPGVVALGPVKHGDMIALDIQQGDRVAIIDGVVRSAPSIRHKEILEVIARGATVIGGGGQGALRAMELRELGMIGVGRVFELFADGTLSGDDEVTVADAGPESRYERLSVPLVSVREACSELIREQAASHGQSAGLIGYLQSTYYRERTLDTVCAKAKELGFSAPSLDYLRAKLTDPESDIVARDSRKVLEELTREFIPPGPCNMPWWTDNVVTWLNTFSARRQRQGNRDDMATPRFIMRAVQLLARSFPPFYEAIIIMRMAELWQTGTDQRAIAAEFSRRTGIRNVTASLARSWLYPETASSTTEALLRLAVVTYREAPGLPPWHIIERMLPFSDGTLDTAAESCSLALTATSQRPRAQPTSEELITWIAGLWGVPARTDIVGRVAYARGFKDDTDWLDVTRKLYVLGRYPESLQAIIDTQLAMPYDLQHSYRGLPTGRGRRPCRKPSTTS